MLSMLAAPLRPSTSSGLRGAGTSLLLGFFNVISMFSTLCAVLAQGQLVAVLPAQVAMRVIVVVFALRALEANEGVLAHVNWTIRFCWFYV